MAAAAPIGRPGASGSRGRRAGSPRRAPPAPALTGQAAAASRPTRCRRGLTTPRPAAGLVERAAEIGEAGGGFGEGGVGALLVALGAALDAARLPERGDPGTPLPH